MGNVFSVAEIVDIGIEKEKKRRDFYDSMSRKFKEEEIKKLFSELRDWEKQHIEKFQEIKKGVDATETTESYQGELRDYMQTLIEDELYKESTLEKFAETVKTPLSAIQFGMSFEREAILFFSALKNFLQPSYHQTIQKLIDEEKQHLIYLSQLKKHYKK